MKKAIALPLIILCLQAFSQVDKIKSASSSNSKSRLFSSSESRSSSGSSCSDVCATCCMDVFITNLIPFTIEMQEKMLKRKDELPRIISLDLIPQFGYNSRSNFNLYPRVRGNWGIFSTDIRYTALLDEGDFWNTFDWQVLQINWVILNEFNLRTGLGFMYEIYSKKTFPEYTLDLDFWLMNQIINPSLELRYADDYYTGATPRLELSGVVHYRIMQTSGLSSHLSFGANFQEYYANNPGNINSTKYWAFLFGFLFNFH